MFDNIVHIFRDDSETLFDEFVCGLHPHPINNCPLQPYSHDHHHHSHPKTTTAMAPKDAVDVPAFAATQLALLDLELQSELAETSSLISTTSPTALQRAGLAITNLTLTSQRTGLGGKTVVELGSDSAIARKESELAEHGIRTGDIVVVSEMPSGSARKREVRELESKGCRGVVTRVGKAAVWVALDEREGEEGIGGKRLWLVKLANDVTYKR
jgi:DNA polymerase alpha-associated DNA helicase A